MKQVVAALIVRDDEILICQRTERQPHPLKWEFPGGKIEANEEPAAALCRELEEELGIEAKMGPEVATIQYNYANGNAVELQRKMFMMNKGEIGTAIQVERGYVIPQLTDKDLEDMRDALQRLQDAKDSC